MLAQKKKQNFVKNTIVDGLVGGLKTGWNKIENTLSEPSPAAGEPNAAEGAPFRRASVQLANKDGPSDGTQKGFFNQRPRAGWECSEQLRRLGQPRASHQ